MAEKSTLDLLRDFNKDIDTANKTLDAAGRAVSGGAELFGFPSATAGKKAPASGTAPTGGLELQGVQGASVLESAVQTVGGKKYFSVPAPDGTRIIIPRQVSSTGQERYLGAHALESVINLMNGSEKCGNIVVLDSSNQPSRQYYDIDPEGRILLKGTNKEIKLSHEGSNASVILSEKEFDILKKALSTQTNDVTHFKTTKDRGYAEDSTAEKGSWFSRNWWKILLGLVIAGGIAWGGVAIHNNRLKKKEKKAAQAAAAASNTNENANTNSSQNSSASTGTNTASALTGTNITNESANLTVTQNSGNSL
ncbi:MAG: hypothetical protein IJY92_05915 [Alphaproteobacteria bacterium]|nr:hypothetical protein [Alphaproteobacteria bacterium]